MNIRWGTFLAGFLRWLPALCAVLFLAVMANAQDVVGSKDPAGVKRYEGRYSSRGRTSVRLMRQAQQILGTDDLYI